MSGPQMKIGTGAMRAWGVGDKPSAWAVGDRIYVPADCGAVRRQRIEPGLHRVDGVFSIDEQGSFYYRLARSRLRKAKKGSHLEVVTDWDDTSSRIYERAAAAVQTLQEDTCGMVRLIAVNDKAP